MTTGRRKPPGSFFAEPAAGYCRSAHGRRRIERSGGIRAPRPVLPTAPPCGILKKKKTAGGRHEQGFVRLSRPFRPGDAVRAQPPDGDPCPPRRAPDLPSRWRDGDRPGERRAARTDRTLRHRGEPLGAARLQPRRPRRGRALSGPLYRPELVPAHGPFGACRAGVRPLRNRDDPENPRHRARDRVAARRLRHRGQLRRHAVRADRRVFRAILAARRRLAALLRARRRPSSTSGCASRSS